ncbi:CNP1-like family protein [Polaromonas sp. P1(28)-8]|nr:CNP1-like family protein [Polaromonas sp. P1(28)-8]
MTFKPAFVARLSCIAIALGITCAAWAQSATDDPDWKESDAPPPPAFDAGKLVTFDVSPNSSLVFGVDPATIRISNSDGLVRYVMVATSASGARNVMYEGIRCATGEYKTYARYSARWPLDPGGQCGVALHVRKHAVQACFALRQGRRMR